MTESSARARAEFDRIVETLGDEVERTQMMGSPILMRAGGKMLACLDGEVLAVKLGRDAPELAEALALPGAATWSPQESRRQFSGWVALPVAQSAVWLDWTRTALDLHDEAQLRGRGGGGGGRGR